MSLVFKILAAIVFGLATFEVKVWVVDMVALGLLLLTISFLV